MEEWVSRALARWPNVPHLYGWLRLNRRGRWLIRGELISRPQILDTINPNYEADERGCWFFQNGPQRGYVELEYAPLIAHDTDSGDLATHTGKTIQHISAASLDENGWLMLATEHGPALLADNSFDWALQHLQGADGQALNDENLEAALAQPDTTASGLQLAFGPHRLNIMRLDAASVPQHFGFVRTPEPPAQSD